VVEKKLDEFLDEYRHGQFEGSIISSLTAETLHNDDTKSWDQIRAELEDVGITTAAFEANKEFILGWFTSGLKQGLFEEQPLDLEYNKDLRDTSDKLSSEDVGDLDSLSVTQARSSMENLSLSDSQQLESKETTLPPLSKDSSQNEIQEIQPSTLTKTPTANPDLITELDSGREPFPEQGQSLDIATKQKPIPILPITLNIPRLQDSTLAAIKSKDVTKFRQLNEDETLVKQLGSDFMNQCFIVAAKEGVSDILQSLIRIDCIDINYEDGTLSTALIQAIRCCNSTSSMDVVKWLIQQPGINVNIKDVKSGGSPLIWAIYECTGKKNMENVRLLLEHPDIDVNATATPRTGNLGWAGWTPLMLASYHDKGGCGLEITQLLLEHPKIDANILNPDIWTAAGTCASVVTTSSRIEILKLLVEHPKVNINLGGCTNALIAAVRYSNKGSSIEAVKMILRQPGVDVNIKSPLGHSPLYHAARNANGSSSIETAKLLLQQPGIDVNIRNNWGETPLIIATLYSSTQSSNEMVQLLLTQPGIDVTATDKSGETALVTAQKNRFTTSSNETVFLLTEFEKKRTNSVFMGSNS
jgi:ankyrin repeat protein